ncbi:DUF1810 domain-containing protein [Jannaschia seohaensis]|uniref:Uncharacterized protein (DUF1810 family) n=1 Tax=Jannaschia seohaensis TaxID=475081 RepID=A0A2Y9ABW3_9RHOB|nr:DUF1810 family protein [Jannaschia seohaensis]PWJ21026.1 uncharacterized protein (DUF1810 family) [Jannaschia seohaensis]SSA41436.1 Uncharacterized protein, DUF1810 family [Jannaschia seohaensis]
MKRFHDAQAQTFDSALAELRAGRKRGHWMWFVFPQVAGLGRSDMARRYAIADAAEARAYLADPVLHDRLERAAAAMLLHRGRAAEDLLGGIDAMKLRSSMTLFDAVDPEGPWRAVLDAFYESPCEATLKRLGADRPG